MLRAMDSAVAGLRAHQNKLDVIGHNIANVNTYGFKSQNYTFQEAMYQTSSPSTAGTATAGGINAAQYGYGSLMGSISMDLTSSTPTYLGGFSASIDGEGFFITMPTRLENVNVDDLKNYEFQYTRVGMFQVDANGYLLDSSGNFIYGFQAVDPTVSGNYQTVLTPLRAPSCTGTTTTTPAYIDANGKEYDLADLTVVDAAAGTYTYTAYTGPDGTEYDVADLTQDPTTGEWTNAAGETITVTTIDVTETVRTTTTYEYSFTGEDALLSNISINSLGEITATVQETDQIITFGKVAIATFQNPNGLTKTGGNYYTATTTDNTGTCTARMPGDNAAELMTGYVEASNVDLAKEFADMITTQRGFQANSKLITVSDEILAELINMKR